MQLYNHTAKPPFRIENASQLIKYILNVNNVPPGGDLPFDWCARWDMAGTPFREN